ncbi:Metalloprotease MmpA [Rubripirellula obstinata]|uniref:Metalloprotease MmpA n=1 Tax=Rubripirellula obstinata TaxID=406547 RepID=A0A5B1CP64_9BACT|nr:site-2 protease family protein [Rubripirellula obstinata]KAA1262336.1 Metalloprotease MmpA [Rubripirellula obstinata]
MIELFQLLAATDDAGFLSGLIGNIFLWAKVALGIGLVIFVHELGHFVAAKSFGVKCEKFYVGFDVPISIGPIKFPRTLGKFTYGETEYGIGVIPLGGYVKMLGQDDDPRKLEEENKKIQLAEETGEAYEEPQLDPRSFPAKPVWQRMIIISAGVVVNVITGIMFAAMAFGFGVAYKPAVVGGVTPGGPAWQAGIEPGGQVVSIGDFQDDKMPFREMLGEILTLGMKGGESIPISIRYDDGIRDFNLKPQSDPADKDIRRIGVAMPNSVTLTQTDFAIPDSVAADVLTDEDAGATIVAFDGNEIDEDKIVPGTAFYNYMYTHPAKPIELKLRRSDGSSHNVTLPPQMAKSLGLRHKIGPISSLVADGPADVAGMKPGDVITAVDGNENIDAYSLATDFAGATSPAVFTVMRDDESLDIEITPGQMPQPLAPTHPMMNDIGINVFGLAYKPEAVIASVNNSLGVDGLQAGDRIKSVRLLMSKEDTPEYLDPRGTEELREGRELSKLYSMNMLIRDLQAFPVGTEFEVHAMRGSTDSKEGDSGGGDKVVTATLKVMQDDLPAFERGLNFPPSEAIRQAGSPGEALALGLKEGKRRFQEVIRFLGMLPRGQVKLRHVGGPLAIVDIAKGEAEKGISRQLMFLTMLSMNLAILNFLPIPALDGGHMVFLTYELIAGKRANEALEFRLTVAGLLSLLALMVVVFANDVMRYF